MTQSDSSLRLTPILAVVRTCHERDATIMQAERFLQEIYKEQKGTLKTLVSYSFSEELAEYIQQALHEENVDMAYKMKLQQFFIDMTTYLKALPVLSLQLAFIPPRNMLVTFSQWVRDNLDPSALIAYHIDETIVAGAVIEYKGMYSDFTLHEFIDQSLKKNKPAILAQLT